MSRHWRRFAAVLIVLSIVGVAPPASAKDLPAASESAAVGKARKSTKETRPPATERVLKTKDGTVITAEVPGRGTDVDTGGTVPVSSAAYSIGGTTGDFITGGESYTYAHPVDSVELRTRIYDDRGYLRLFVSGATGKSWDLWLAGPAGARLNVGRYDNAKTLDLQGTAPGIRFGGYGGVCNLVSGHFTIHQIHYNTQGLVDLVEASFLQKCEGSSTYSVGHVLANTAASGTPTDDIHFVAYRPTTIHTRVFKDVVLTRVMGDVAFGCKTLINVLVTISLVQTAGATTTSMPVSSTLAACGPGLPIELSLDARAYGYGPFADGPAEFKASVTAFDQNFSNPTLFKLTSATSLTRSYHFPSAAPVVVNTAGLKLRGAAQFGQPNDLAYTTASAAFTLWSDGGYLYLRVKGTDGRDWTFYVTGTGGRLDVGRFSAQSFDFKVDNYDNPKIGLSVNDSGMGGRVGAFTIHQIAFGSDGALTGIDASFKIHLGGEDSVTAGYFHINMAPKFTPVKVAAEVLSGELINKRTLQGRLTGGSASGTVTCSRAVKLNITGYIGQWYGSGSTQVDVTGTVNCTPGAPATWHVFGNLMDSPHPLAPGSMYMWLWFTPDPGYEIDAIVQYGNVGVVNSRGPS